MMNDAARSEMVKLCQQLQNVDQQLRLGLRNSRPPSTAVALVGRTFDICFTVCSSP